MKFFRNVYEDLVERKLLPLAVLLILALVAVPLTLSKSMPIPPAVAASSAAPALDVPSAVPAVSLSSPDSSSRLDHLGALNPFEQRHKQRVQPLKPASAPTTTAAAQPAQPSSPAASSSGASIGAAASSPSASSPSSSGPVSSPSPSAGPSPHSSRPPARHTVSSLQVRFGPLGHTGGRHGIDRLAPLPDSESAAIIYLGMLRDHKTASFLVSSDAHAEGDGRCLPSPSNCQKVYLRAGQTEFFDQTNSHGGVTQYQLDVIGVAKRAVASARTARRMSARVSRRGQRLERHSAAFRAPAPR